MMNNVIHERKETGWFKYLALSLCVNFMVISLFNLDAPEKMVVEMRPLAINLMSLAAPHQIEPAAGRVAPKPAPLAQKIETQKAAVKKVPAYKPAPKIVKPEPVVEKIETPTPVERKAATMTKPAPAQQSDQGAEKSTVIHEAKYRKQTPPLYPLRALELGQQGTVTLHAKISQRGLPQELKIASSSGYRLLDNAAVAAVKKWEFEPQATQPAMTSWVRVPVNFVIR